MPVADRCRELLGGIGLDEVTCPFDDDGVVVGEGLLPSPQFVAPERDVGVAPDDECEHCREVGESDFDVGEKGAAGDDLTGEDSRRFPPRGAVRAFW